VKMGGEAVYGGGMCFGEGAGYLGSNPKDCPLLLICQRQGLL
jgi:hypothetical protein